MITMIEHGTVCSPKGFEAAGIVAGLKKSGNPDMALIYSETGAIASGAFTSNRFCAAPVIYDRQVLAKKGLISAIIVNSGNANACTGEEGYANTERMAELVAQKLHCKAHHVLVSSTGRIGVPMPMDVIENGIELACRSKSVIGGFKAAEAIMTTDTYAKHCAVTFEIDGKIVTIGGMAKGAGMIAPRLIGPKCSATMLCYLTTDAKVTQEVLDEALQESLDLSFNRITVDGDTSTNDTFVALANGLASIDIIQAGTPEATLFKKAFVTVAGYLARQLILDGEGVSKFVELRVKGAPSKQDARRVAESIANSPLCKTAWFGADPNWGRILCAAGYSGVEFDPYKVNLDYEGIPIVRNGRDAGVPEEEQAEALRKREFGIDLDLGAGDGEFTIWTCDLTYEYVKINADYHT